MQGFGVDVGGSGIKGAPVDLEHGRLAAERVRVKTPQPSTPAAVAQVVGEVVTGFGWSGPIGCTLPCVVSSGVARTAANVDHAWIDTELAALFAGPVPAGVHPVNDADAAGLAEVRYGAGKDQPGVVLVLTLGTGIGSGLFLDGKLVPNTELGHLEIDGHDAEQRAADSARERHDLSYEQWARRVQRYLKHVESLFWPDLIILGGGVSKKADQWLHLIDIRTRLVVAGLQNDAGIIGAALLAAES